MNLSRNGRSVYVGYSNSEAVSDRDILFVACNELNSLQTECQFSQLTCTHAPSVNDNRYLAVQLKSHGMKHLMKATNTS
jgi:hypothetical protein